MASRKQIYDAFPNRKEAKSLASDLNASTPPSARHGCPNGAGAVVRKLKHPQAGGRLRYGVYVNKSCKIL